MVSQFTFNGVQKDLMTSASLLPENIAEDTIFVRDVPISKMFIAYRDQPGGYARPTSQNRVRKMTAEFEAQAVGVVLLSLREDGTYAMIDGAHRMFSAKNSGMETLDAYVYIDLTLEEEAHLYRKFGEFLKQSALDRYAAAQTEKQPETIVIDRLLAEVGLHVSRSGNEAASVKAVASIQRVATELGPQVLRETLRLLHDAFGINPKAYTTGAIWGTAQFLIRFSKDEKLDYKRLVRKLREEGVAGVLTRAHAVQALEKGSGGNAWGKALHAMHNDGARAKRLGEWPTTVYTEAGKVAMRKNVLEKATPALARKRQIDMALKAQAVARCNDCRAEPGAACRNVKGEPLNKAVHNARTAEYRRYRDSMRRNGKD